MASDIRGDTSAELALLVASALVRRFNAAVAAGDDHMDADTLPLLASMRAVSVSFRHGTSAVASTAVTLRQRLPLGHRALAGRRRSRSAQHPGIQRVAVHA